MFWKSQLQTQKLGKIFASPNIKIKLNTNGKVEVLQDQGIKTEKPSRQENTICRLSALKCQINMFK